MQHKDDPQPKPKAQPAGTWLEWQRNYADQVSYPAFKAWYRFGRSKDLKTWLSERFEQGEQ
jgi:hypothetical protein